MDNQVISGGVKWLKIKCEAPGIVCRHAPTSAPIFTTSVHLMKPEMVHSAVRALHHMYRFFTHSILQVQFSRDIFPAPKQHRLGLSLPDHLEVKYGRIIKMLLNGMGN